MTRGPAPGRKTKVDFAAKARLAYGAALPDWIAELAAEATRTSLTRTAKRLGYSDSVLSYVLSGNYTGDIGRVEQKVRGALMGLMVYCRVHGEISRDRCLNEQRMGNTGASSIRAQVYRACRDGLCPHSRLTGGDDAQS